MLLEGGTSGGCFVLDFNIFRNLYPVFLSLRMEVKGKMIYQHNKGEIDTPWRIPFLTLTPVIVMLLLYVLRFRSVLQMLIVFVLKALIRYVLSETMSVECYRMPSWN